MGLYFFDQYSYLHFASGIIAYFWNLSVKNWLIIHTIFEILENTTIGIHFINKIFTIWPGGKPLPDSFQNILGDTFFTIMGWLSAYYIDKLGNKYGWYSLHIQK